MDALLIGKNGQNQLRELSGKYGEEHKEEKKAYTQEYIWGEVVGATVFLVRRQELQLVKTFGN